MGTDAVALTRDLVRFDTVNPPGRERDCARHVGAMLQQWGFAVEYYDYEEGRTSLVARAGGSDAKAPLCLTGHIDVVPLGTRPWSKDPFSGETDGDRLFGRGTSDMKAGVAAMLLEARSFAGKLEAGYKGSLEGLNNDFYSESFDPALHAWTPDAHLNNTFGFDEQLPVAEGRLQNVESRRTHAFDRCWWIGCQIARADALGRRAGDGRGPHRRCGGLGLLAAGPGGRRPCHRPLHAREEPRHRPRGGSGLRR